MNGIAVFTGSINGTVKFVDRGNLVDIILDVEEAFSINIDNLSMEKMLTVKATLEIIEIKLAEK